MNLSPTHPLPYLNKKTLLSVQNLSVEFGSEGRIVRAVSDLSFEITRNKTLAIVGESGSGKSITALAILRLVNHIGGRITSGEINFESSVHNKIVNLNTLNDKAIRAVRGNEIAMIFQEPMTSLNPVFTIGSQICETLMLHRGVTHSKARSIAKDFLDLVRLPSAAKLLDSYPHQLSGGMRQRAMIAMALSCQPKILIADEPTAALDVTIQAQILNIIRDLQAEFETSVIFISHDMGVVSEMADDVLVMKEGKLVEMAPVNALFDNPQEEYTKALLAAVPKLGDMRGTKNPAPFIIPGKKSPSRNMPLVKWAANLKPIIKVENLTTRYDIKGGWLNRVTHRVHAVENLTFAIYPGETLALVGESGSGKSTVGKTIQQLVEPVCGAIRFHGQDILSLPAHERKKIKRQIQYIFQDPYGSLNPRKTVAQSIIEPATAHDLITGKEAIRERVNDLLVKVGLSPEHANRYPHEFSGGQRQRICIARALANNPSLIIADEAVSALDVSVQAQVINLLMKLQADQGLSYLFITHDMAVVERISHRVAVMYLGQIVEIGSRQQIFENPQHPYTKRLIAAVPVVNPRKRVLRLAMDGEIPSVLRPVGDEPEVVQLQEIEAGHFVARTKELPVL